MDNTHPHAIGSVPSTPQSGDFRIDVVDKKRFALDRLGAIRHNYHQHPLMQMDRLAELAKSLVATEQCRFIVRNTTVSSEFHYGKESPVGRSIEESTSRSTLAGIGTLMPATRDDSP